MTRLLKSIRNRTFPLWELKKIRYHKKTGYQAKVKVKFGTSDWLRMSINHIWVGPGEKKMRISGKPADVIDLIERYDIVKVRIPALESKYKKCI